MYPYLYILVHINPYWDFLDFPIWTNTCPFVLAHIWCILATQIWMQYGQISACTYLYIFIHIGRRQYVPNMAEYGPKTWLARGFCLCPYWGHIFLANRLPICVNMDKYTPVWRYPYLSIFGLYWSPPIRVQYVPNKDKYVPVPTVLYLSIFQQCSAIQIRAEYGWILTEYAPALGVQYLSIFGAYWKTPKQA